MKKPYLGNRDSVIYMSKKSIYVAYYSQKPYSEVFVKFTAENKDLFPKWFIERLEKISKYKAKQTEIWDMLRRLTLTMKPEERVVFENELYNRLKKFIERNAREIERTKLSEK